MRFHDGGTGQTQGHRDSKLERRSCACPDHGGCRSLLVWVETDAGQDVPVHGCHPVVPVDPKFPHWAAPVTLPVWPSTSAWARARSGGPGPGPGPVAPRAAAWRQRPRASASNLNSEAAFEVRPGASGMAH